MAWNYLIDPPEPGATLEDWEEFLADLLTSDQTDEGIAGAVRQARFEIALRRGEVSEEDRPDTWFPDTS